MSNVSHSLPAIDERFVKKVEDAMLRAANARAIARRATRLLRDHPNLEALALMPGVQMEIASAYGFTAARPTRCSAYLTMPADLTALERAFVRRLALAISPRWDKKWNAYSTLNENWETVLNSTGQPVYSWDPGTPYGDRIVLVFPSPLVEGTRLPTGCVVRSETHTSTSLTIACALELH